MKIRTQLPHFVLMFRCAAVFALLISLAVPASAFPAQGDGITKSIGPSTNLPLPRFVSLKKDEVYMRKGPGPDHAIVWIYHRQHMPLEVVNEYDLWREVRDLDGSSGWISANMLSGERFVVVLARPQAKNPKDRRWALHRRPDEKSEIVAVAEPGVVAELKHCPDEWCQIDAGGRSGWIERSALWGIHANERIE